MFMCSQCLEQFEDNQLAYTLILESRLTHPAADMYLLKFCSKAHVQEFLTRIGNQRQRYLLTRKGRGGDKAFAPDFPRELLILVGSSKAS